MKRVLAPEHRIGDQSTDRPGFRQAIWASVAIAWVLILGARPAARAEGPFAIHDGDRIVFYGDSITDQRLYTTFVETYIVTHFPSMNVEFVHSGWGGDRVTGGGGGPIDQRLARDVFAYKPTVVTVMLGMNDASYQPFNQRIFDVYARGYQHLVESLKSHSPGVRITLIVPSPFDDVTRQPRFEGGYNQVLLKYGEFVRSLAEKEGATVADLNMPVVAALKKAFAIDPKAAPFLIQDRVHPGPGGQLLMAEALLKAWNPPPVVWMVEIDGASGKLMKQENTKVEDLQMEDKLSWKQVDSALPMWIDLKNQSIALAVKASDVEQALNQQILKVSGLDAPRYQLKVDGDLLGEFTKDQLAAGVSLAEFSTPMLRQARAVHELTVQHNNIHFERWRSVQVPFQAETYPGLPKALEALDALEGEMVARQRATAKPVPHQFQLLPLRPSPFKELNK